MSIRFCRTLALLAAWMPCGALAFDLGDPTFPHPYEMQWGRFEVFYESYQRDINIDFDDLRAGGDPGSPIIVGSAPEILETAEEAGYLFFRMVNHPSPMVALQFDLGFSGSSSSGDAASGDPATVFGGTGRVLLTESGPFQLAAQVSGHFTPEFAVSEVSMDSSVGPYVVTGQFNSHEYGGALIGSITNYYMDGSQLSFYAAPRLSAYRGKLQAQIYYENLNRTVGTDSVGTEASPFGLAIGSRFASNSGFTARIEGRVVNELSFSAGLGLRY